jgi:hypothetical protein
MRWLERYLTEGSPRLRHFAEIVASLAGRDPDHVRHRAVRLRRRHPLCRGAGRMEGLADPYEDLRESNEAA